MNSFIKEDFNKKQEDIDVVIELAKFLEKGDVLKINDSASEVKQNDIEFHFNEQLVHVLKSVIYMMSYNQLESTARSCLEEVYDHLDDEQVGYEELQPSLQKEILTAVIKNHENGEKIHKTIGNNLNKKIPKVSLKIKKVFNGNICRDTFTKIHKDYGLRVIPSAENRDGIDLDILRDARNDLAHGNKSFSEFGAGDSIGAFVGLSSRVTAYISSVITAFDNYIEQKKYLSSSNST